MGLGKDIRRHINQCLPQRHSLKYPLDSLPLETGIFHLHGLLIVR